MSFLPPNQQCHSTEGKWKQSTDPSQWPAIYFLCPPLGTTPSIPALCCQYQYLLIIRKQVHYLNVYQLPTSSFSMVHLLSVIKNTMLTTLANFHTHKAHAHKPHINGRTCVVSDVVVGIDAADFFAVENTRVPLLAIHWIVQDVIQRGQPHVWVDASYL